MLSYESKQIFNNFLKTSRNQYRRPKTILRFVIFIALGISLFNQLGSDTLKQANLNYSKPLRKLRNLVKLRTLVNILPDGDCEWVEPTNFQGNDFDLFSTVLVSFPGSAKRAAFLHLEGLTELLATDDYNLNDDANNTKYAFIKTQYPHHEGKWSWGNSAGQTIYIIQNPRMALQTYMFLLHEISYSSNWWTSYSNIKNTFTKRPPVSEWEYFKKIRFHREMSAWSWHLEFWVEGGLQRDVFSHNITTPEHMEGLMNPSIFSAAELTMYQGEQADITPHWDKHCVSNDGNTADMADCRPVTIASYENIIDPEKGPEEVARLAAVIKDKPGLNVTAESSWGCVWEKVVTPNVTGMRVDADRKGPSMDQYTFSIGEMVFLIDELKRLRAKYNHEMWFSAIPLASVLIVYLDEYIADNEAYLRALR